MRLPVWLLVCVFVPGTSALAATRVRLTVLPSVPVLRSREPVTSGIPIPKDELRSVEHVRLLRGGEEIPAQFRAAGLWRPGDSIRWLLVDCQLDIPADARPELVLEYGEGVTARAKPDAAVQVAESPDAFAIDTGAATFRISRTAFSLFDEVRLRDGTVLVARPVGAPRRAAAVSGLRRTVTRAIPAPANTGRSHLITVQCSGEAGLEDFALRFTADREFEVVGERSGRVGRGVWLKDFRGKDGLIVIPADAWLRYHYPEKGDAYTFRTVPAGTSVASEGVFESTVLERGPLRSVIRVKGSFGPATAPVLEWTAWYHFYAGTARVKLAFTLENNGHGGRTGTGNARNADIGGINCVFFDDMSLRLPLAVGGAPAAVVGGEQAHSVERVQAPVVLYQDSSGGPHWDRYRDPKLHPRPNSYVSFRGYRVLVGDREAGSGDRAAGWLSVSGTRGGAVVCLRDFWQSFPKALAVEADGTIEIGLFPGRYAGDFPLRSGEHKTHEILFAFRPPGRSAGIAFEPARLEPSAEWFARTRALGDLHPFDVQRYAAYEMRNLSAIGVFPEGVRPGPSLLSRREEHCFYGWMDYGDVSMDFEAASGQWGMKYDMDFHMAQHYARTLRPEWWGLFVAADRHTADIDIHHQPHYPGLHFVKGGVWAHSLHGEAGHRNPHRNHNHFTKDLCFGARGTAALHYLTGRWKAHDACLEIAENALAQYMSPQKDPGPPERNNRMGWRGDACTLNRLLEGYLLGGDERLLRHARWQVASCAFDGKPPKHGPTSLWSSVFYMMALARFVEMFPDDAAAKSYLLAHIETLRRSVQPDGIWYTVTPRPDGSVVGKGTCSHYNIMAADALAIGYRLTGDMGYMDAARRCFAYGVRNACWKDGPPTYIQVHSANGALDGNVFMVVESALRAKGD